MPIGIEENIDRLGSTQSAPAVVPAAPGHDPARFRVGNIQYTRYSLATLFVWLLWGDFAWAMMERLFVPIMQLKLKGIDPPNWLYAAVMTTIPSGFSIVLGPIVGFRSDRHRGPRGRRTPFLLAFAPCVSVCLVLLAYVDPISRAIWRLANGPRGHIALPTVTLVVLAVMLVSFNVCNSILQSIYYYLFNDVVPRAFMTRFMAYFRMIGVLAGMLASKFIFRHIGPYDRPILLALAAGIFVAFVAIALKIKEPDYPPPPSYLGKRPGRLAAIKTYFAECFSHRFYWIFFIEETLTVLADCTAIWQTYLWLHLGMSMQDIGNIAFYMAPFTLATTWLSGVLGDRIRPLPLMVCAMIALVVTCPIGMLYLIPGLSAATYLWIRVVYLAIHMPIFAADGAARQPFYMSILPHERYGQYAAAMDMVRALVARIFGTIIAGLAMDGLQKLHHGTQYYLRYVHVWSFCCEVLAVGAMFMLYYQWKKLGGRDHFVPPAAEPHRSR